jgi:hypothetical protein
MKSKATKKPHCNHQKLHTRRVESGNGSGHIVACDACDEFAEYKPGKKDTSTKSFRLLLDEVGPWNGSYKERNFQDFNPNPPKTEPPIKDSGERRDFATGARRDIRDGKGRFDLLPCKALRRMARHFEKGAVKYGIRNWEKGMPLSDYMDSALRHAFAHLEGKRDEDHAAAAAWNLLCFLDTEERIAEGTLPKELDDMPPAIPPTTPT